VAWSKSALVGWQQVGGLQVVHELADDEALQEFRQHWKFEISRYDETSVVSMPGMVSICLSLCPIYRLLHAAAVGLLLLTWCAGDIDLL